MLIYLGLLYFIGRAYHNLALRFDKKGWLYVVLGIACFFFGFFGGAVLIVIVYEVGLDTSIDDVNEILLDILCLPFGIGLCWGFYKLLEYNWSKPKNISSDDVLDSNLLDQNQNNFN